MKRPPIDARPLSRAEKALLVAEILRTYVVTRWLMRRSDVRTVLTRLRGAPSGEPPPAGASHDADAGVRLGRAVARTLGVLPTDSRCLTQSLVLSSVLARRGIESSLLIGVATEPEFLAHAWVEEGGRPILPRRDYATLIEL